MANKNKLTVVTPVGTFTRSTARTYTHIVVSRGQATEVLAKRSIESVNHQKKQLAEYTKAAELSRTTGLRVHVGGNSYNDVQAGLYNPRTHVGVMSTVPDTDTRLGAWPAEKWQEWADGCAAQIADSDKQLAKDVERAKVYFLHGWCGRLDLAQKLASKAVADGYQDVQIFEVK